MICIHDDDDDDDALKNGSVGRCFFLTERSDPIRTSWREMSFPMLWLISSVFYLQ